MKADQIEDFSDILADIDTKLLPIVDPSSWFVCR
jgi:hypothetical protein